jgi:predicted  nucleic acid-binding Zn-ribbon protein
MSDELAQAKQLIKTLQGQIQSLQYTKNHDYKFLVEENRRLEQELNETKADNKKLAQQIEDITAKLRDANF